MIGTGIGGFVFVQIMNPVINPDDFSFSTVCFAGASYGCFPESVNNNFEKMFYILIACWTGLTLIGIIFVW
jgi:hypothetical protein